MKTLTTVLLFILTINSIAQDKNKLFLQVGIDPAVTFNISDKNGNQRPGGGELDITFKGGVRTSLINDFYIQPTLAYESFQAIDYNGVSGQIYFIYNINNFDLGIAPELTYIFKNKPEQARLTAYDKWDGYSVGLNASLRYNYKNIYLELNGNYKSRPDEKHFYHNYNDPSIWGYSNTISIGLYF